jgi:hypothetical protein
VANRAAAGRSLVSSNSSRARSPARVVSKAANNKTSSDVTELLGSQKWGPFYLLN